MFSGQKRLWKWKLLEDIYCEINNLMKKFKLFFELGSISFLVLILISLTLLLRVNIFGQHSNGGFPLEINTNQKLNILGFVFDFIFYFIIIFALNLLTKRLFKWKVFQFLPQIGALIIIIALTVDSISNYVGEICSKSDEIKPSQELELSLRRIPKNRLFYYYQGEKIPLSRRQDKCGRTYFILRSPDTRIYIDNRLAIGFIKNLPNSKRDEILRTEKLILEESIQPSYWLKTTNESKFLNAIEESNYLVEKYPELEYAEPNMLYIERAQNIINYLRSEFFGLIYSTKYQMKTSSELANIYQPQKVYDEEIKGMHVFSNKTLKEHINDYYKRNQTPDLKLIEFNSGNFDVDGKTNSGANFIMISKEHRMLYIYSVISNQIETYTQPTDGEIDYKSYNLGEIKDSPEIIKEALRRKGDCSGFLDLYLFQDKPEYVTVECIKKTGLEEKVWTTEVSIRHE